MKMINEADLNILVSNVVSENRYSHCRLCLRDIKDNYIRFEDCVSLNPTEDIFQPVSEILTVLLDPEICDEIPGIDALCSDCVEKALQAITFINKCKHSSYLLEKIFDNLTESLKVEIETTGKNQRLYVIVSENESRLMLLDNEEKKTKSLMKRKLTCKECKGEFVDGTELTAHNLVVHAILTCEVCLQTYHDHERLELHQSSDHKYKCTECHQYENSEEELKEHADQEHTIHVCKECGKSCRGITRLQAHEDKHGTRSVCPKCGKTYITKDFFVKHVKLCLEDQIDPHPFRDKIQKQYFCEKCGKGYSTSGGLRVHDRFVHGNAKHHICEHCGKKFTAPSYLKIHMIKHTGEKNFKCTICGNNFVSKEALLYHTRRHTGEKPYFCKYCSDRFVNASARAEHIKFKHTGPKLTCEICKRKFFTTNFLRHHMIRHHDPTSKLYAARTMIPPNIPGEQNMRQKINAKELEEVTLDGDIIIENQK